MQSISPILLVLSVISPILAYFIILLMNRANAKMALIWTTAFFGLAISWLSIFFLRFGLPTIQTLVTWQPQALFFDSPAILADGYNWGLAIALTSLGLAFLFTEPSLSEGLSFSSLANGLLMVSLADFGILAGNQLTLLLAWAAIDLVELFIWLSGLTHPESRERIILAFTSRASGLILSTYGLGQMGIYLLASFLRLGVFPFHIPYIESKEIRRGFGSILRLVPPLVTIPFLVRLAGVGRNQNLTGLIPLIALVALSAALLWIRAENELEGRPFWIITISAFILIAALKNEPAAALAWGIVLVCLGGGLFLSRIHNRYWTIWAGVQVLILSGIPFSPLWDINRIYKPPVNFWSLLIFFAQMLLIGGFWLHSKRRSTERLFGERWIYAIYNIGITLLYLLPFVIGYLGWKPMLQSGTGFAYPLTRSFVEHWIGILILLVLGFSAILRKWIRTPFERLSRIWKKVLSFNWVIEFLKWGFRKFSALFNFINLVFEGQGGILWALLMVILLGGFLYLVTIGG